MVENNEREMARWREIDAGWRGGYYAKLLASEKLSRAELRSIIRLVVCIFNLFIINQNISHRFCQTIQTLSLSFSRSLSFWQSSPLHICAPIIFQMGCKLGWLTGWLVGWLVGNLYLPFHFFFFRYRYDFEPINNNPYRFVPFDETN